MRAADDVGGPQWDWYGCAATSRHWTETHEDVNILLVGTPQLDPRLFGLSVLLGEFRSAKVSAVGRLLADHQLRTGDVGMTGSVAETARHHRDQMVVIGPWTWFLLSVGREHVTD